MEDRLEVEIQKRLAHFDSYNVGDNIELSVPVENQVLSWMLLFLPLLFFSLFKMFKIMHGKIIKKVSHWLSSPIPADREVGSLNTQHTSSKLRLVGGNFVNHNGGESKYVNARANDTIVNHPKFKRYRKHALTFLLFVDILFCGFCFGIYQVPILNDRQETPDYDKVASSYKDLGGQGGPSLNGTLLSECCYDKSFASVPHTKKFSDDWALPLVAWWKNGNGQPFPINESGLQNATLAELIHAHRYLSLFGGLNNIYQLQVDSTEYISVFLESLPPDKGGHAAPLGFWTKSLVVGAHKRDVCCVCYMSPVTQGRSTEIFVIYGILLLLGVVTRSHLSLKVLFLFSCWILFAGVVMLCQNVALNKRDIYGMLVPSTDMRIILRKCIETYLLVQSYHPMYYVIITHAAFKTGALYITMVVTSVLKRRNK